MYKLVPVLFLTLLICPFKLNAQTYIVNYEIGYNANYANPEGANSVVNEYNTTRDFLTKEMEEFDFFGGFTAELGLAALTEYSYNGIYLGIGYNGGSQKRYAEGSPNGSAGRRDVKITDRSIYGNLAIVSSSQNGGLRLMFGARGELAFVKVQTKLNSSDWEKTDKNTVPYFSPFVKIIVNRFNIEPYYRFELFKDDRDFGVEGLNKEINPSTASPDPSFVIPYGGNSFGLRITVNLLYGVDYY